MPASSKPTCLAEAFAALAEAQKAHDAATTAYLKATADADRIEFDPETKAALAAAREGVPIPTVLLVPPSTVRTVLVSHRTDGSEEAFNIDHAPWRPKCPADVYEHCAGDVAKRDEMLAALHGYDRDVRTAEAKAVPALTKARKLARRLELADDVARSHLHKAAERLSRVPASNAEEALAKVTAVLHAYGSGLDQRGNVVTGMKVDLPDEAPAELLGSLMADLRSMATSPEPQPPKAFNITAPEGDPVVAHLALADAEATPEELTDRYWELIDGPLEADATSLLGLAWRVARLNAVLQEYECISTVESPPVEARFRRELESMMRSLVRMGVEPPHAIRANFNVERVPFEVGARPSPDEARARWDAALAAFLTAKAAHVAVGETSDAATRRIVAALPPAAVIRHGTATAYTRWPSLQSFDHSHSPAEAHLRAELEDVFVRLASDFAIREHADQASDGTYDAMFDAEAVLMATPAPDLAAVVLKSELLAISDDDDKRGFDDLGWVSDQLHGFYPEKARVQIHHDLQRLSGIAHPSHQIGDWNPRVWIAAFEKAGAGVVSTGDRYAGDDVFFGVAEDATLQEKEMLALLIGKLYDGPGQLGWKHRAVALVAQRRRETGADPLRHHDGERRPMPLGQGWRGPYTDWRQAIDFAELTAALVTRVAERLAA